MNLSEQCVELVAAFEGLRLRADLDPIGIPTIGYGAVRYPDGTPVRLGDEISEAEAYLIHELEEAAEGVSELTDGIALNQNQFEGGDNDVAELQERLQDLGFYRGDIDGDFGRGTDQAVRAFQAQVFGAAEADGKVGPLTWGKLFADQPVQEPQAPGAEQAGLNYLYLTRTGRKDQYGLEVLQLALYKDGRLTDSLSACSGVRSRQHFRKGIDSFSGSMEPIPEGRWTLGDVLWKDGEGVYGPKVWSSRLGPAKIFLCYQSTQSRRPRRYIEIHLDWSSRSGSPGTGGTVAVSNVADFKRLVQWLSTTDPKPQSLYVDWQLGTCPVPELLAEQPCTKEEFFGT